MAMDYKRFNFETWTELSSFINAQRETIVGKQIDGFYWTGPCFIASDGTCFTDTPFFLVIGDVCIGIDYYYLSSITIHALDRDCLTTGQFRRQMNLEDYLILIENREFQICGVKINDVSVERFSHEFVINPVTDETRPDGGDYFSTIICYLDNGKRLCICAEDAMFDGYVDVWVE